MIQRRAPLRRRKPVARASARIARTSRPSPLRRTTRASLARQCAALWSGAVLREWGGRCWLANVLCRGPIDPAHVFPKGACPAVRYDPAYGLPTCRFHHRLYGNGERWLALVRGLWGDALFEERYRRAHQAGARLDLRAVRDSLKAAA